MRVIRIPRCVTTTGAPSRYLTRDEIKIIVAAMKESDYGHKVVTLFGQQGRFTRFGSITHLNEDLWEADYDFELIG